MLIFHPNTSTLPEIPIDLINYINADRSKNQNTVRDTRHLRQASNVGSCRASQARPIAVLVKFPGPLYLNTSSSMELKGTSIAVLLDARIMFDSPSRTVTLTSPSAVHLHMLHNALAVVCQRAYYLNSAIHNIQVQCHCSRRSSPVHRRGVLNLRKQDCQHHI